MFKFFMRGLEGRLQILTTVVNRLTEEGQSRDRLVRDHLTEVNRQLSELRATEAQVQSRLSALERHDRNYNQLKERLQKAEVAAQEARQKVDRYAKALGPIWRTQQGDRMPMALLSTDHLKNISNYRATGCEAREFAEKELRRREIDEEWCKRGELKKQRQAKQQWGHDLARQGGDETVSYFRVVEREAARAKSKPQGPPKPKFNKPVCESALQRILRRWGVI